MKWSTVVFALICVVGGACVLGFLVWAVERGHADAERVVPYVVAALLAALSWAGGHFQGLTKTPKGLSLVPTSLVPSLFPSPSDDELTGRHRLPQTAPVPPDAVPDVLPSVVFSDELAGPDAVTPAETPEARRPVSPPAAKGRRS